MSFVDVGVRPRSLHILSLAGLSFRAQWFFFAIPLAYLLSNWMMLSRIDSYREAPITGVLMGLLSVTLPVGVIVMLVLRLIQFMAIEKPESPISALASDIKSLATRPALIINGLPVFAAMIFFNKAMFELKPAIPMIRPFSWDVTFMEWDRMLHFGFDPWVLLQPVLGHELITFAINMAYNFWFVALFGAWFWFGFKREASAFRAQFFLSYMLAWWLGGGLLAVFFSSAGPCYYDELGLSPNPFTGLFAYLNDANTRIPLWFLDTQQMLWDGYAGKVPALGISAFPSMHNASAVLFALAFRKVSRGLGLFFAVYAVVILLGSVHLGWHYAIDGYAGAVIAVFAWWIAGLAAAPLTNTGSAKRYNEALAAL